MNGNAKCSICGKTVYAMERMDADGLSFHKTCMRCEECKCTLKLGNYASLQGRYYCKTHFKQLFKLKGNYDQGFGREQPKMKWLKESGLGYGSHSAPTSPVSSPVFPRRGGPPASSPLAQSTETNGTEHTEEERALSDQLSAVREEQRKLEEERREFDEARRVFEAEKQLLEQSMAQLALEKKNFNAERTGDEQPVA